MEKHTNSHTKRKAGLIVATKCYTIRVSVAREKIMSSKNRITINLSEEEYDEFVSMADGFNVSVVWIGRQVIREFLDKYQDTSKGFPLPVTSGRIDKHNKIKASS